MPTLTANSLLNDGLNVLMFKNQLTNLNTNLLNKAAIYCRLSRDDGNNSESNSIVSQKDMLRSYANENNMSIHDYYIDDGISGTTFDRPEFQRLVNDVKCGNINVVLTKDLSRLGRNYVQAGMYTDFFQDNNVRMIAINDNYDTNNEDNDIAPFRHILNEMYAKDISKKVKSSRKVAARNGWFMGSLPPYGYRRSEEDNHVLVVDDYSEKVVKEIFELFNNSESARGIAERFNSRGIQTPQNYYYQTTGKANPYKNNKNTWCSATILTILRNEVYLGHMVQNKRATKSFKSKDVLHLPKEMWTVVKNTHKPIISDSLFEDVQLKLSKNKNLKPRKNLNDDVHLFSGLLYCKDCNSKLTYNLRQFVTTTTEIYRC